MNLSKNSWHYRFLDRYDAKIIKMSEVWDKPINLCPYVRAVFFRLVAAFLILPPIAAFAVFAVVSPFTFLLFWGLSGVWDHDGIVAAFALIASICYVAIPIIVAVAWVIDLIKNRKPKRTYMKDTLVYQAVKSWHDKVCPILDVEE